jgi:hypothetical protein
MNKKYEKYYRDGKVAVLYSPGYGVAWFSWNTEHHGLLFDKEIVEAVLANDHALARKIAENKYNIYAGGATDLQIEWLKEGTAFEIREYDGDENIIVIGEDYLVA